MRLVLIVSGVKDSEVRISFNGKSIVARLVDLTEVNNETLATYGAEIEESNAEQDH